MPPRKAGVNFNHHFWERRRPKHLLTGKIVYSSCASPFSALGKDYLGCLAAKHGTCRNIARVRHGPVEERVLDALRHQLMQPEHVELFVKEFTTEWNLLTVKASASTRPTNESWQLWSASSPNSARLFRARTILRLSKRHVPWSSGSSSAPRRMTVRLGSS